MKNTNDLAKLGYRELDILADLIKAYANTKWESKNDELYESVKWEFNNDSGNVFLLDEDYNTAMLNNKGKLENWLNCGNCGNEGFRSEIDFYDNYTCKKCNKKGKK